MAKSARLSLATNASLRLHGLELDARRRSCSGLPHQGGRVLHHVPSLQARRGRSRTLHAVLRQVPARVDEASATARGAHGGEGPLDARARRAAEDRLPRALQGPRRRIRPQLRLARDRLRSLLLSGRGLHGLACDQLSRRRDVPRGVHPALSWLHVPWSKQL